MLNLLTATLICVGQAPTHPVTEIELEVKRTDRISTIRYEIVEGSLTGTAYVQSVGYLQRSKKGDTYIYKSGESPNSTVLTVTAHGAHLTGELSHYSSGMKDEPVECRTDDDSGGGDHDGH